MSAINTVSGVKERAELDLALASGAYTNAQWDSLVERSVSRVNRKLGLDGRDGELTLASGTYTRSDADPVTSAIGDIVLLQTECIIVKSVRRSATGKGIKVKDGDSSIDTTASFGGYDDVVNDICGELDKAIIDYQTTDPDGESGAATHGGLVTYDNSNTDVVQDHNGDGYDRRDYRTPFDES